jgi:hypothetical protein
MPQLCTALFRKMNNIDFISEKKLLKKKQNGSKNF